jgi:hypothetical protein
MTTCSVCLNSVSMYDFTKYVYRYSTTSNSPTIHAVCKECSWQDVPETNAVQQPTKQLA